MKKIITKPELIGMITESIGSLGTTKARLKKTVDEDGVSETLQAFDGVGVVWISNRNYQGGRKNGYGPGLYARLQGVGLGIKTILLTQ